MLMRNSILLFVFLLFSAYSKSQPLPEYVWKKGRVQKIFVEPNSDIVIVFSNPGPCGSSFYHITKSAANHREFYALALSAGLGNHVFTIIVKACVGDRNFASHGTLELDE